MQSIDWDGEKGGRLELNGENCLHSIKIALRIKANESLAKVCITIGVLLRRRSIAYS